MPILEFAQIKELEKWINDFVTPDRYAIVVTDNKELIVHPTKTSRPIVYGYIKGDELEKVAKELVLKGYKIIQVKSFTWDIERIPGTKLLEKDDIL